MINNFSGSYRFLSNFYPARVTYEGVTYPTSEHAYQAAKTWEKEERKKIARMKTPGEAKRYGRSIALRAGWDSMKVDVMREILYIKFRDEQLRQLLLDTGDEDLIEGNDWGDVFWGQVAGRGQNWLGRLLMELRDQLRLEPRGDAA